MAFPFFQHIREASPGFRRRMLTAKFTLAVTPTAARNHSGHALVRAAGEYGNSCAEAATHQSDALGIHFRARGHIADCVARIGDLIEADNSPMLALPLTTTTAIDAQAYRATLAKLLCYDALALAVTVTAETMQYEEC